MNERALNISTEEHELERPADINILRGGRALIRNGLSRVSVDPSPSASLLVSSSFRLILLEVSGVSGSGEG